MIILLEADIEDNLFGGGYIIRIRILSLMWTSLHFQVCGMLTLGPASLTGICFCNFSLSWTNLWACTKLGFRMCQELVKTC